MPRTNSPANLLPLVVLLLAHPVQVATSDERPRLVVLTDIGGDPDDTQSLIRLMTCANEFEIEALIASASGTPGELKRRVVRPDLIRQVVEAYAQVRDNLARHAPGYPTGQSLLDRIRAGNPQRGLAAIGEGHDTDGSDGLIRVVDSSDARPVNITIWGGQTDLVQALWRVREDRGPGELSEFVGKIRVYDIADQDGLASWIHDHFPELFYVLAKAPEGVDKRVAVFRGMYLGGDQSLTSRAWIDRHVRLDHGPLGALYPPKTWTAPNPQGALKEGDTPSWFYFLASGLSDPAHPEWGSWGGRFQHDRARLFRDARDVVGDQSGVRATVWRWRAAYQNDFQARMDWCTQPPREANHPPVAVLNGDRTREVRQCEVEAGSAVQLTAADSHDPDGDALAFRWWFYDEPSTYEGRVPIQSEQPRGATVHVPRDASGRTIHIILEVTDDGAPPLTSYRRAVLRVK